MGTKALARNSNLVPETEGDPWTKNSRERMTQMLILETFWLLRDVGSPYPSPFERRPPTLGDAERSLDHKGSQAWEKTMSFLHVLTLLPAHRGNGVQKGQLSGSSSGGISHPNFQLLSSLDLFFSFSSQPVSQQYTLSALPVSSQTCFLSEHKTGNWQIELKIDL